MTEEKEIDLRRYTNEVKSNKKLYIISAVLFIAMAVFYHFYRMDKWDIAGDILIESETRGGSGGAQLLGGEMSDLIRTFSLGSSLSKSVDNEAYIVGTKNLIYNAVVNQRYNHTCIEYDGLSKTLLHKDCPIRIETEPLYEDTVMKPLKFCVFIDESGVADIEVKKGMLGRIVGSYKGNLPTTISTDYGTFAITLADTLEAREYDLKYVIANRWNTVEAVADKMLVTTGQKTDIVTVDISDANRERGIDFLNALFSEYNTFRRTRKNKVMKDELDVINERLAVIAGELSASEATIEEFQNKYNITSLPAEISYLFQQNKEIDNQVLKYRTQQTMLQMALSTLRDKDKYAMLPMMNLEEAATNSLVERYNQLVLERISLLQSAKEDNVSLRLNTENIEAIRSLVIESIEKADENISVKVQSILNKSYKDSDRLSNMPAYEREYYDMMRNKMFTNQLYLFLLQKRENNILKIAAIDESGNVIQPAYSPFKPSNKKSIIVLVLAIFMAAFLPTVYLIYRLRKKDLLRGDFDFDNYENVIDGNRPDGLNLLRHTIRESEDKKGVFVVALGSVSQGVDYAVTLHNSLRELTLTSSLYLPNTEAANEANITVSPVKISDLKQLPYEKKENSIISLSETGLEEGSIVEHPAFAESLDTLDVVALTDTNSVGLLPKGSQVVIIAVKDSDTRAKLSKTVASVSENNKYIIYYI